MFDEKSSFLVVVVSGDGILRWCSPFRGNLKEQKQIFMQRIACDGNGSCVPNTVRFANHNFGYIISGDIYRIMEL